MVSTRRPVALTIAGTDSSGGAGVVADLKTFEAHGVWGTAAITAVTAQNTLGVQAFDAVTPELVRAQIASVASDLGVDAAKTGMLASAAVVEAVAATVVELGVGPLVVDPVLVSKHGDRLLAPDAVEAIRDLLLPRATVLTPNLPEAEALVGFPVRTRADMEAAARALLELGPEVVLVKGGHLAGEASPDCLLAADAARRPGVARGGPHPGAPHPRHRVRALGCHRGRTGPGDGAGRRLCRGQALRRAGHRRRRAPRPRRRPGRPGLGTIPVRARPWMAVATGRPSV